MNFRLAASLALAVILLLVSSCGESIQEQVARKKQQAWDEDMAIMDRNAKALNLLYEQCEGEITQYWAHPKSPFLKSCLDYQLGLKNGIKDRRALDQCHDDLMDELPSCSRWRRDTEAEIERLKRVGAIRARYYEDLDRALGY